MPGPSLMPLRFLLSPLGQYDATGRRMTKGDLKAIDAAGRTASLGFSACWTVSNPRGTGNLKWPGNRITDIGVQTGARVCTAGNWINKF